MPTALKSMFSTVSQSSTVTEARDYISSNAQQMAQKVEKITKPYTEAAVETITQTRTFVNDKVAEVKSAGSVKESLIMVLGFIMALVAIVISFVKSVRDRVVSVYDAKWSNTRHKLGQTVTLLVTKAGDLPASTVGKKVEIVSKRLLGDKRHGQTVDFIKTSVIPKVYKSYEKFNNATLPSPSGSSNADLTTEGGSVSAMSPAMSANRPKKTHIPKRK